MQELLDEGLCQELNDTLGTENLEGNTVDVLYHLAKQGYTEEVFRAIPQASMTRVIEHVGINFG